MTIRVARPASAKACAKANLTATITTSSALKALLLTPPIKKSSTITNITTTTVINTTIATNTTTKITTTTTNTGFTTTTAAAAAVAAIRKKKKRRRKKKKKPTAEIVRREVQAEAAAIPAKMRLMTRKKMSIFTLAAAAETEFCARGEKDLGVGGGGGDTQKDAGSILPELACELSSPVLDLTAESNTNSEGLSERRMRKENDRDHCPLFARDERGESVENRQEREKEQSEEKGVERAGRKEEPYKEGRKERETKKRKAANMDQQCEEVNKSGRAEMLGKEKVKVSFDLSEIDATNDVAVTINENSHHNKTLTQNTVTTKQRSPLMLTMPGNERLAVIVALCGVISGVAGVATSAFLFTLTTALLCWLFHQRLRYGRQLHPLHQNNEDFHRGFPWRELDSLFGDSASHQARRSVSLFIDTFGRRRCGLLMVWLHVLTACLLLGASTVHARYNLGSRLHNGFSTGQNCPQRCACIGLSVDCSFRGLKIVPSDIPPETERLDLKGNNITHIRRNDFTGLRNIRVLQLPENRITKIERGAFQDLIAMERLRLNDNLLTDIPDLLFANMPKLYRLDLSYNRLANIGRKTLKGAPLLKNLQMDNNQIKCITDSAVRNLHDMEILTLNKNNITSFPKDIFSNMKKLRILRIGDNHLVCDCHLNWLASWLRQNPRLGLFTKCYEPESLKGQAIEGLQSVDFRCNGYERHHSKECLSEMQCPRNCVCSEGVIDCRGQGLKDIPDVIPESTTDLRLDENHIARIPAKAFAEYKNLRRIDLGNNEISYIASDAFTGLSSLNSLILYGNKINDLPQGIFRGLTSLQLLLLNANKISCIRVDTFEDLRNLNLLSLYDNKIQSLPNGTFQPLKNIQTLHLARNPFICDCNLRWLSEYLHSYPVETSGARCESPRRMRRKKIGSIRDTKFKCKGTEHHRTKYGNCVTNRDCPRDCDCSGTIVDCTGRSLTKIPETIPMYVTELKLVNNDITRIEANSVLKRLPNLQILDFKNNKISTIEDGAFDGLEKLQELILTYNKLNKISSATFRGLTNLMILKLASNRISCVDNETYNIMSNLRFLSLFDNQIRCIMQGAFGKLHYLSTLNIMLNPFNCNCHLSWLPEWLKRKTIVSGRPLCFTPHKFKDMPILSLTAKDLVCEDTNNNEIGCNVGTTPCCPSGIMDKMENSCDPRAYCPPNCTCSGTIVRCIKQNLKYFPKDIPMDTTDLYLDFNNISIIPKDISRLTKLTQLDISNNQLVTLPDYAFANLSHLSTLILSYNPLQCLSETSFSGLTQLRILSLHENKLSTIPYGTFKDLHSITHLVLGGNPLYCDCNLKWLSDWIKKDFLEAGIATCSGPEPMTQKLLLTTPSQNFQCDRDPDPTVLSKCNACYENPCQHGSTCTLVSFKNFTCTCAPGYYGTKCENEIDACFGNPCFRGTCEVKENGRFKCHCPRGFEGYRCEVNIDDCVTHSCQNNATCIDQIETYTCKCLLGYTGKQCQKKIVFCEGEYNFCQNGASCKPYKDDYVCDCPVGYTGKNCSENVDDCKSHICQNGAKCRDELNGYTCICPTGYLGKFCEIAPIQISDITAPGVCLQHECQNNGLCYQPSSTSDYMCRCASGFSGKKCEKLHEISFREKDAYIALPKIDVDPQLNITVIFSTKQDSGILLYTGVEQHIAAELFWGRIRISFDVGNYPLSTMFSFEAVADGKFHKFQMLVEKTNFTMIVDSGAPRTVVNDGPNKSLMVDDPLYLGGLPADVNARAAQKWHIREGSSFIGCFQKVIINGHQQDFSSSLYNHKMIPGCQELKKVDPCANHKCKNGKCTPHKGDTYKCRCRQGYSGEWCDIGIPNPVKKVNPCDNHQCKQGKCTPQKDSSYKCRCRRGYSGKHCDIAPTCRDIVYRDTYKDPKTGCISRTKVKFRRCEGSCGRHCCKPKKIKTRRIRLFCVDGTNFIYNLPVIRKCGCKRC